MNNNKANYLLTKVEEHLEQAEYRLDQAMMQSAADFDATIEATVGNAVLPLTALMRSDLLRVGNFLMSLRAELNREPEPEPEPEPDNGKRERPEHIRLLGEHRSRSGHVTKDQALDIRCLKCGSKRGDPCHKVITNKWNTKVTDTEVPPHRERKDAYRRKHGIFVLGE